MLSNIVTDLYLLPLRHDITEVRQHDNLQDIL